MPNRKALLPFVCMGSRAGHRHRPPYPRTITTSRVRGPWTPSTRSSSMSLVALGPLIMVSGPGAVDPAQRLGQDRRLYPWFDDADVVVRDEADDAAALVGAAVQDDGPGFGDGDGAAGHDGVDAVELGDVQRRRGRVGGGGRPPCASPTPRAQPASSPWARRSCRRRRAVPRSAPAPLRCPRRRPVPCSRSGGPPAARSAASSSSWDAPVLPRASPVAPGRLSGRSGSGRGFLRVRSWVLLVG